MQRHGISYVWHCVWCQLNVVCIGHLKRRVRDAVVHQIQRQRCEWIISYRPNEHVVHQLRRQRCEWMMSYRPNEHVVVCISYGDRDVSEWWATDPMNMLLAMLSRCPRYLSHGPAGLIWSVVHLPFTCHIQCTNTSHSLQISHHVIACYLVPSVGSLA